MRWERALHEDRGKEKRGECGKVSERWECKLGMEYNYTRKEGKK